MTNESGTKNLVFQPTASLGHIVATCQINGEGSTVQIYRQGESSYILRHCDGKTTTITSSIAKSIVGSKYSREDYMKILYPFLTATDPVCQKYREFYEASKGKK